MSELVNAGRYAVGYPAKMKDIKPKTVLDLSETPGSIGAVLDFILTFMWPVPGAAVLLTTSVIHAVQDDQNKGDQL